MAAQWLTDLLAGGAVKLGEGIANIVDKFKLTPDEKAQFQLEMERLLQARDAELEETMRTELSAKERILVAELTQGDNYTKRARPTVVYGGLAIIAWNYSIVPLFVALLQPKFPGITLPVLTLPGEFWYAWGGVVATWSVGRTMERRGAKNNLVSLVTGNSPTTPTSSLLK